MCVVWLVYCSHVLCPPKESAWRIVFQGWEQAPFWVQKGSKEAVRVRSVGSGLSKLVLGLALVVVTAPSAGATRQEVVPGGAEGAGIASEAMQPLDTAAASRFGAQEWPTSATSEEQNQVTSSEGVGRAVLGAEVVAGPLVQKQGELEAPAVPATAESEELSELTKQAAGMGEQVDGRVQEALAAEVMTVMDKIKEVSALR